MAEGQIISCHSEDEFNQQFQLAKDSKKLVLVDFTASWCGPCRIIASILEGLVKKTPNMIVLKVDVDEVKTVAEDWQVEAMPTLYYLKEGTVVDKSVGARKDELEQKVAMYNT